MKINISRQHLYLLFISVVLFFVVVIFSFGLLIPEGKEYRIQKAERNKELKELRKYQDFSDETYALLKELQSENRHIIEAFDTIFDIQRFEKQHKEHFESLSISKIQRVDSKDGFGVYEVKTSSKINTPKTFYNFLDAVNKSDWIIEINFPIDFKRQGELITSSFTMKVYHNSSDTNETAAASVDK